MGWAIGTGEGGRDIGYGVPAVCDHPKCNEEIDRGVSYCCGGYGTDLGCNLYFCSKHLTYAVDPSQIENGVSEDDADIVELCEKCKAGETPFDAKPDILKWVLWKFNDRSWELWRKENPREVDALKKRIVEADDKEILKIMAEIEPQMEQHQ